MTKLSKISVIAGLAGVLILGAAAAIQARNGKGAGKSQGYGKSDANVTACEESGATCSDSTGSCDNTGASGSCDKTAQSGFCGSDSSCDKGLNGKGCQGARDKGQGGCGQQSNAGCGGESGSSCGSDKSGGCA